MFNISGHQRHKDIYVLSIVISFLHENVVTRLINPIRFIHILNDLVSLDYLFPSVGFVY